MTPIYNYVQHLKVTQDNEQKICRIARVKRKRMEINEETRENDVFTDLGQRLMR